MHFNEIRISAAAVALSSAVSAWSGFDKRTDVTLGIELRIMPLGASITYGSVSSDGNGYRLKLAELLSSTKMTFIGSVQSGNMDHNYNEGHPGVTIREVANFARASLGYRPNATLLHIGTNEFDNVIPKGTTENSPKRLSGLIDDLIHDYTDANILVAQLIHAANSLFEKPIQLFNDQVPKVVTKRANEGYRVTVADMRSITKMYLVDGIYPIDVGYQTMADVWFAIEFE